ncbi:MAG TPA: hypothetical protein VFS14_04505 [Candidatus Saccharimonadales bacterium]|nr:hypothetical protein [Candidatus Saccharimonadales bacterium]
MTTNGTKQGKKGKRSPLVALKPLVILTPADHALDIVLGVEGITRSQRDAAIEYLNETLAGSDSFKLGESRRGGEYVLHGTTAAYVGDEEFHALCQATVRPKYPFVGELTMKAARLDRKLMGVECVVTAKFRSSLRTPVLPQLDTTPSEALALEHEGNAIAFTVRDPDRPDSDLIKDALAVAAAFGVYVEKAPRQVADEDRRARLYPEFRHTALSG